jgi:hypothetical protein
MKYGRFFYVIFTQYNKINQKGLRVSVEKRQHSLEIQKYNTNRSRYCIYILRPDEDYIKYMAEDS